MPEKGEATYYIRMQRSDQRRLHVAGDDGGSSAAEIDSRSFFLINMKREFFTPPIIRIFAVVAVIGLFVLLIYLMAGMPAPRKRSGCAAGRRVFDHQAAGLGG